MKTFLAFMFALLFSGFLYGEADFRGFSWGATEDEVRSHEQSASVDLDADNSKKALVYQADVSEYKFKLNYLFDASGMLLVANYSLHLETLNTDSFGLLKKFFMKFEKLLSEKYGSYSLPSRDVDIALMSNDTTLFTFNEDLEYFLKPDDTNSTKLSEMLTNERVQKIIDENRCRFALKWQTDRSVVILEVLDSDATIYYCEKNTYKSLNDRRKGVLEESKKNDLGNL